MVVEVALSAVLLTGAGLMLKSLVILNGVELGFQPARVLTANVNLPETRYPTGADRFRFFDALAARLSGVPGVESVAFANRFPLRGGWETGLEIDGVAAAGDGFVDVACQAVSPGYFQTLGIPLLRGRLLTPADTATKEPVAVVSDEFSRRYLSGGDPMGHRVRRGEEMPWITIVGVVHDVRRDGRERAMMPQVLLAAQTTLSRSACGSGRAHVRRADRDGRCDPERSARPRSDQPITAVRTLDEILSARAAERRFETLLFFLFAALASCSRWSASLVSCPTRCRNGRRRSACAWRLAPTAAASSAGFSAHGDCRAERRGRGRHRVPRVSRFVAALLFQVQPRDAAVYTIAALLLAVVALGTSAVAARTATKVNPTAALRAD